MPLEISGLSVRYGTKWALRDIDLIAGEGRIIGICGAAGSGKSSLLRALAGIGPAFTGTVSGNLGKGSYFDGCSFPNGSLFRRSPQLSAGEWSNSQLEATLSSASRLRLLDEPFAHRGDDASEKIKLSAPRSVTLVASSSFERLAAVADEIIVLAGGYIARQGPPQQVYDEPQNTSTAMATGANNLIAARRLTSTNADMPEFQTIDGGHRFFAKPVEKHRLGAINQNVNLAIRPEQITMSMGASFPEDNLVRAIVTGIRFEGACTTISFDAGGLKLSSKVFRVVGLEPGQECMLGLPPDRISILKD